MSHDRSCRSHRSGPVRPRSIAGIPAGEEPRAPLFPRSSASRSRAIGAACGTTRGAPASTNTASRCIAACIAICGRTVPRSAWSSPITPSTSISSSPSRSYPPREVLYDYITGRAKDGDLKRWIQFKTAVRHVVYDKASDKFKVTAERLSDHTLHQRNVRLGRRRDRPFLRAERAAFSRHRDVSRPRPARA